ncbi:unnamed protein product [Rangifer tarandus platyrhynchus]|uniref:Uncharacterized protein n=1 Tax=Rangifer tarandus platyrhynchus TaxID=3082113 RepID=A0ABN8ZDA5_RANTA|nr:unnamed protein product [Rangifer tarandus platyrhynchus]
MRSVGFPRSKGEELSCRRELQGMTDISWGLRRALTETGPASEIDYRVCEQQLKGAYMIENKKTVGKRQRLWRAERVQAESREREQKELMTGKKGGSDKRKLTEQDK